jgi:inositol transport system permease protein
MKYTLYGKHTYAIGSNEDAARMSGINVARHKVLVYAIAGMLAAFAAIVLSSKNLTAQSGMGLVYELDAIAMAVIGGTSLNGGRGSILGTVLGALIFGVIISGFTYLKLDAYLPGDGQGRDHRGCRGARPMAPAARAAKS